MAKIVINNVPFDYDYGCAVLKLKHTDCPFPELADIWEDIIPMSFKDIAKKLTNLEQRRVAILYLGLERLKAEVEPQLVSKETIRKTTTWVTADGNIETRTYDDTYELFKVAGDKLGENLEQTWRTVNDVYYVRCKDTSTDREYFIWVDKDAVVMTNNDWEETKFNPIAAIAWTFTTLVPEGKIEKIIRQGDCILIKHKKGTKMLRDARHLTEQEYRMLLEEES